MRFPIQVAVTVLMVSLTTACPQVSTIWLEPGSTVTHLLFHIARSRGSDRPVAVGVFRVDRCKDPADYRSAGMWVIGGKKGTVYQREVVYARLPDGFEENHPARPLTPGCYQATVSGTGRLRFNVRPDGSVYEFPAS